MGYQRQEPLGQAWRRQLRLREGRAPGRDCTTSTSTTPSFGPGFIKICTYFPYPAKVWLNGHEWAKRQARRRGHLLRPSWPTASLPALSRAPAGHLRPLRARLTSRASSTAGPRSSRHRSPLRTRQAGYFWELSMRQVEVSRTLVFDDPRRARGFFEALGGRQHRHRPPEEVRAVFVPDQARRQDQELPSQTRVFSAGHRGADGLHLQA